MRFLVWLVRAAVFFALFAFALNNQHESSVRWFFGQEWRAPMVIVVLAAFGLGVAFGIFAMVPSWWRQRRVARREASRTPAASAPASASVPTTTAPQALIDAPAAFAHPPRDGL